MNERLHIVLRGLVQGVGFRFFTMRAACRFNLTGWVRNVGHDKVEITAEGPRNILESFLEKVSEGPSGARVRDVEVDWQEATGEFEKFEITYDQW